ncbi:hypothetical protein [Undibacter mobilis]|uniref:Uncharacterized protein n=1 Tax=Undibacter mobilis TaxID=2292256 RepID=A0A371B6W0_9BRAD|nr:hypothetical protein [Undibacter mobilis]RDV03284.1 hypothetical protein DXH78_00985 [Undibacter mobilis]
MKTPKVLSDVEHEAARQLNMLMRAVKKQYHRFVSSGPRPQTVERRYIRAAEETIASAEKIIRKLKPRIAAAKRSLGVTGRKVKQKTARATAKRVTLKKRAAGSRKKKL